MRYFRRELLDAVQRTSDAEAHAAWEQAREACSCAFDNDRDRLPESARAAAERSWHDAVVTGATAEGDDLVLELDGRNCCWPEGDVHLTFRGVRLRELPAEFVGDTWLYEEWSATEDGAFELRVLCRRTALRVVAREIEVDVGAFPIRVASEHRCADTQGWAAGRVVWLADGDAGATFWHVEPREVDGLRQEDDALEDAVLVRNLLATRPCVERCPFCGERLAPPASPHES